MEVALIILGLVLARIAVPLFIMFSVGPRLQRFAEAQYLRAQEARALKKLRVVLRFHSL